MQRQGQLDDPEVRGEVAPVDRADADQGVADLARQRVDVGAAESGQVRRRPESVEEHGAPFDTANPETVQGPAPIPQPISLRLRARVWTDLARIISTVFNPFLTSLALFVILAGTRSHSTADFWLLLANSVLFTSIVPMLFVFWLYATDRISDLDMSIREERERVFVAFVVCFALGTVDLWLIGAPRIMTAAMAGYGLSALVVQWITRYWKISTHALGITASLVALWAIFGSRPLPFFILIPLVCWARVYLRAHTPAQVIAGAGLAAVSTYVMLRLFHIV